MEVPSDIAALLGSIKQLSESDQNILFNSIRSQHRKNPFHRVKDCTLCNNKLDVGESSSVLCEGCEHMIDSDWVNITQCSSCMRIFQSCDDEETCVRRFMEYWPCSHADPKYDTSLLGICHQCAKDLPPIISCREKGCKETIENKHCQVLMRS
jgi:hypothetical protein